MIKSWRGLIESLIFPGRARSWRTATAWITADPASIPGSPSGWFAGLLTGIVHDRRLMREAELTITIRWFIGCGLH